MLFFIGLSCSLPFYSTVFTLFNLSIGWYCGARVFGLIGCKLFSPSLALPTFNNKIKMIITIIIMLEVQVSSRSFVRWFRTVRVSEILLETRIVTCQSCTERGRAGMCSPIAAGADRSRMIWSCTRVAENVPLPVAVCSGYENIELQ